MFSAPNEIQGFDKGEGNCAGGNLRRNPADQDRASRRSVPSGLSLQAPGLCKQFADPGCH